MKFSIGRGKPKRVTSRFTFFFIILNLNTLLPILHFFFFFYNFKLLNHGCYFNHFQVSKSIFRKYSGPVDIWLSKLFALFFDSRHLQCLLNEDPSKTYAAMAQHRSQWIWFVFSKTFNLYLDY